MVVRGCSDGGEVPVHPRGPGTRKRWWPHQGCRLHHCRRAQMTLGSFLSPSSQYVRIFPLPWGAEVAVRPSSHQCCSLGAIPSKEGDDGSQPQPSHPSYTPASGRAGTPPGSPYSHLHLHIPTQLQFKAAKLIQDFLGGGRDMDLQGWVAQRGKRDMAGSRSRA